MAHWVSVIAVRIKVASHLATLKHSAADLEILKRQQALIIPIEKKEKIILMNPLKKESGDNYPGL